jgi:hypothetical protein
MMIVGEQRLEVLSRLVSSAVSSCKVLLEDLGVADRVEVGMGLGLLGSQTFLFRG